VFFFPLASTGVSSSVSRVPVMVWGMKGRQLLRVFPFPKGHDAIAATPSQGEGVKVHGSCGRSWAGLQGQEMLE